MRRLYSPTQSNSEFSLLELGFGKTLLFLITMASRIFVRFFSSTPLFSHHPLYLNTRFQPSSFTFRVSSSTAPSHSLSPLTFLV
ncbi:hypothetical protein BDV18DRAFT_145280 [Aspergillus unguis]